LIIHKFEICNMEFDGFIQVPFTEANLDRYLVRKSILDALNFAMPKFGANLLDIGCGKMPYRTYILEKSEVKIYTGIDIEGSLVYDNNVQPDLRWDGRTIPLSNDSFEAFFQYFCSITLS